MIVCKSGVLERDERWVHITLRYVLIFISELRSNYLCNITIELQLPTLYR